MKAFGVTEVRHDLVFELLPNEKLWLEPAPDSVDLRDGPGGEPPTIDAGCAVTLHEVGRYRFVIERNGRRQDLHVVCLEPGLLDWLAAATRPATANGGATKSPRLIARSLCMEPWFDGTIACLTTGDASRASLASFGA